jgi:hypothetical protein
LFIFSLRYVNLPSLSRDVPLIANGVPISVKECPLINQRLENLTRVTYATYCKQPFTVASLTEQRRIHYQRTSNPAFDLSCLKGSNADSGLQLTLGIAAEPKVE